MRWGVWHRPRTPEYVLLVALGATVLAGVPVGIAVRFTRTALDALVRLEERPIRHLGDPARGPVLVRGLLRGEAKRTPSGHEAVGWVAWLDHTVREEDSDGNTRSVTRRACTLEHRGWTELTEAGARLPLERGGKVSVGDDVRSPRDGVLALHLEPVRTGGAPPSLVGTGCFPPGDGTLAYHEYVVRDAGAVVFSGCRRDTTLAPCGDGLDALVAHCRTPDGDAVPCGTAARGRGTLARTWAGKPRLALSVAACVTAAILCFFGGYQLLRHRHERRLRLIAMEVGR